MSISIKKYVDITSGVGAGGTIRQRDLIGRLFTTNPKVPVDGLVEITSADDARVYFGSTSSEYLRSLFYFSFVSKNIIAPKRLTFARWADAASAPRIFGARITTLLSALQAVTAGTLVITAGANTANLTAIDLSAATSFADVATALQTKIRAATGAQFSAATVTYDAVAGAFNFAGSVAGVAPMSVTVVGGSSDLAARIGWSLGSVMSPGVDTLSITDTLGNSAENSNNFGSFAFVGALTTDQTVEAATWNAARNVEFIFCARVDDTNMAALSAALIATSGVSLTYAPVATQYDEMVPMIVMAATDYTKRNATQNYMFQVLDLTAKVAGTTLSNQLDAMRINYYGNTQTAGQVINFYQRGVMGGDQSAPVDMNTYANELWFKDACQANLMSMLLSLPKVSANADGVGQVIAILQDAIDRALLNGTISVGKELTTLQRLYIAELSDDDLAWHQVQGIGYWVDCNMQPYTTTDGRVEYKAVYTIIYSKDDVIRKVEGTHVLI